MAELDRSTLFANEAFAIGMLQAVSGGALLAAITNSDALSKLVGKTPSLLFLTTAAVTLALAVLAAYFRHQYKMWGVKSDDSRSKKNIKEAKERTEKANCYLKAMRRLLATAVVVFVVSLIGLVAYAWNNELNKPMSPNTSLNLTRGAGAPLAG